MKLISLRWNMNWIYSMILLVISPACRKDFELKTLNQADPNSLQNSPGKNLLGAAAVISQTRTATFLNNLNSFRAVFGDQNYPKATASDVAADDNVYASTSKLPGISDSASSFRSNSVSSLDLQGFGFTIPDNAIIENIDLKLRRFKSGRPSVGDYFLSLEQRYQCGVNTPCQYGVFWTYQDTYPGKIYPDTETEYVFSQSGSGNNGGFNHDEAYQWTPAIVNTVFFGVRIDNFPPIGRGTVVVNYDLVEVTINYSLPAASPMQ